MFGRLPSQLANVTFYDVLQQRELRRALQALGDTLADRGLRFHIAVVGGAALLLRGDIQRPTQDVDVVALASGSGPLRSSPELPAELAEAAQDVAEVLDLEPGWLNAGAVALLSGKLPHGYRERLETEPFAGLAVSTLGREDLIRLKLYAAADEGPGSVHVRDLIDLSVDASELATAAAWVEGRYPDGPTPEVRDVVDLLARVTR